MSGNTNESHSKSKIIGRSQDTAKAWAEFNAESDTVLDSFNVSSIAFEGSSIHKVNFSAPMPNDDYSHAMNADGGISVHIRFCITYEVNVAYLRIQSRRTDGSLPSIVTHSHAYGSVVIFGD